MIDKLLFIFIIGGFITIRGRYRSVWTGIERVGVAARRERILTSGIVLSQLVPAVLWLGDHLAAAQLSLPGAARWLGLGIGVAGLVLLERVHAALGANFSPRLELRADHTLVRKGPYARIRHPMYTAGALLILSYGLLTSNLIVFSVPAAMLLVLVVMRIPDEETMLLRKFGAEYQAWKRETGLFLPRLW